MRAPNITYAFTNSKDTSGPTFEPLLFTRQISSGSANPIFVVSGLPKDRVFVLANATLTGAPGATQNLKELSLQIVTHTGVIMNIATDIEAKAADVDGSLNWTGEIYVLGGGAGTDFFRANALYNSGVNANTTNLAIQGIVIPRGNVSPR